MDRGAGSTLPDRCLRAIWQTPKRRGPAPKPSGAAGVLSLERLSRTGFVEIGHSVNPDLREGVVAMRGGHHGEEVRKQWEPYSDLSDDDASRVYDAVLDLRGESSAH